MINLIEPCGLVTVVGKGEQRGIDLSFELD